MYYRYSYVKSKRNMLESNVWWTISINNTINNKTYLYLDTVRVRFPGPGHRWPSRRRGQATVTACIDTTVCFEYVTGTKVLILIIITFHMATGWSLSTTIFFYIRYVNRCVRIFDSNSLLGMYDTEMKRLMRVAWRTRKSRFSV